MSAVVHCAFAVRNDLLVELDYTVRSERSSSDFIILQLFPPPRLPLLSEFSLCRLPVRLRLASLEVCWLGLLPPSPAELTQSSRSPMPRLRRKAIASSPLPDFSFCYSNSVLMNFESMKFQSCSAENRLCNNPSLHMAASVELMKSSLSAIAARSYRERYSRDLLRESFTLLQLRSLEKASRSRLRRAVRSTKRSRRAAYLNQRLTMRDTWVRCIIDMELQLFKFQALVEQVVQKINSQSHNRRTDPQTFEVYWTAFLRWCKTQVDYDKKINVMEMGTLMSLSDEGGKDRAMCFILAEHHAQALGLTFKHKHNKIELIQKIHFTNVLKLVPGFESIDRAQLDREKDFLSLHVHTLFHTLAEVLKLPYAQADLDILGKYTVYEGVVSYQPYLKTAALKHSSKLSVGRLIEEKAKLSRNRSEVLLEPIPKTLGESDVQAPKGLGRVHSRPNFNINFIKESPTRRYIMGDIKISSDMLGAGTDPISKDQDFSKLASSAATLIKHSFPRPKPAQDRYSAILDRFSRTLAATISAQKYNSSESGRIGCNYNPSARQLYFDRDSKSVRFGVVNNRFIFTASPQLLEIPASTQQQLQFIRQGEKAGGQLRRKMRAKVVCYERYRKYIEQQIPVEYISIIPQAWVDNIMMIIPTNYSFLSKDRIIDMTTEMLTEINYDYILSGKKAILDYVLKDEAERHRIGVMRAFEAVPDYGRAPYKGILADEGWISGVKEARRHIEEKLMINDEGTLSMMKDWRVYENSRFSILNKKKTMILQPREFSKKLDEIIVEIHSDLRTQWVKQVSLIFNEYSQKMKPKNELVYYRAVSTLMSIMLRNLITASLQDYRAFFHKFRKAQYPSAVSVVLAEKDITQPINDVFLEIKLRKNDDLEIVFVEDLFTTVKPLLLKIVDQAIEETREFPSPTRDREGGDVKRYLWEIKKVDVVYKEVRAEIESVIQENMQVIQEALAIFRKYQYLFHEKEKVEEWYKNSRTITEYETELRKYKALYREVADELPFFIRMNMVLINAVDIKRELLESVSKVSQLLVRNVYEQVKRNNELISKRVDSIDEYIRVLPDNTEKLVQLENYIEKVKRTDYRKIKEEFADLTRWLYFCYDSGYNFIKTEEFRAVYLTALSVANLPQKIQENEANIHKERESLERSLKIQKEEFERKMNAKAEKIEELKNTPTPYGHYKEKRKEMKELTQEVAKLLNEMNQITTKEEHLGWSPSDFPRLLNAQKILKPLEDMWNIINDYDQLKSDMKKELVKNMRPDELEQTIRKMETDIKKITQNIKQTIGTKSSNPNNSNTPLGVCKIALENIQDIKRYIPLIRVFANPGLKERHWQDFAVKYASLGKPNELKFSFLNNSTMLEELPYLDEISEKATKEWNIEKSRQKMVEEWQKVEVELKLYKDTETYIITGACVEEIEALLEDQMVKLVTIKGSPHSKIFEAEINEWENFLKYAGSLFSYWTKLQGMWMYLYPVFTSPDISKQLPKDANEFSAVDHNWQSIMAKIYSQPRVIEFTKTNKKMLENFQEGCKKLQTVQKSLSDYLESKRMSFPRFFFLSNEELLEILNETKDPNKVQPHLKKCFEGIQKLKIDEEKKIHGMFSSEDEFISFQAAVDTNSARGNVDEWLIQVESSMIEAVRFEIETAHKEYTEQPREQWVLNRCGMAVLNMDMTFWTKESEACLMEEGLSGLQKFYPQVEQNLSTIVAIVRQNISPLNRCTLQALIVLDVHNREVISQLIAANISRINDFDWQAQLRYYWDRNTQIRIINAVCEYNNQYLGNSSRLVITPLTDRCYRTLCGALHLNYGGAPEGPAGTGKTQTVKDLAKALARHCVVFNCSDGLDFHAMGKFFKGIASSGSWSCFDEFNRINLEVLSVVAQQILTIQLARGKGLSKFSFEDSEIRLKPTANCFITMNPGYAGRSQLPDNLKSLFRSVAMMVPDYALIAEISLYSFGFNDANTLAGKIVTTYKLCSEQLSSQDHYDYGMRAVKSVLTAAGNLKRKFPNEQESVLMLRAINDVNLAKFLAFDIPLFKGIISDLFPGVELPKIDYQQMFACISKEMLRQQLNQIPYFLEKVIQLYEMILVRHGLMVVGRPFSGKTTATHVLAAALTELKARGQMGEKAVEITRLNPKSIAMNHLYGYNDQISHQWYDGILAVKFRAFAKSEVDTRKWLIFDGPIDAVWIQNMNTVLDDNKKLCLNSGEIIAMNKNMNMIFEPMDLLAASPATVSRCGMIYMEPASMGWRPLYSRWLKGLPSCFKDEDLAEIDFNFNNYVDLILNHMRTATKDPCKEISPTENGNLVMSLLRIYRSLLREFDDQKFYPTVEVKQRLNILNGRFVFATAWSFGGALVTQSRKGFDVFLKRLFSGDIELGDKKRKKISLPQRGMLFEYVMEARQKGGKIEGEWLRWVDLINENEDIPAKSNPHQIFVKTTDTVRYSYLLKINIDSAYPTLFCGPTGTGKSLYITNLIDNLDKAVFQNIIKMGFSAQTTAIQTQQIIDSKLDRRGKKGEYGPKPGFKMVLFVDDLNMPAKEKYGAQPPIEIIRQLIDQGGWYELKDKDKTFRNIVQIIICCAMGPPGGGRTFVTPRLLRHMNLVSLVQFDSDTMTRIYSTILKWFFFTRGFSAEIIKLQPKVVASTIEVFRECCSRLLPTPMKSHYLFNLRDFSKVILGVCMSDKDHVLTQDKLLRLWAHEIWRVFADRLVNSTDKLLVLTLLRDSVKKVWSLNFDTVFSSLDLPGPGGKGDEKIDTVEEIRRLLFTDLLSSRVKKIYDEVLHYKDLQAEVEKALDNYNDESNSKMDLSLFEFAVEHLIIISRILKQPGGNALLIGVGGSGRQSLTTLSSYIQELTVRQIEVTKQYGVVEWRDDLKLICKQAGGKGTQTVFLFTDSQIKRESFVEDINNLLNTGEVPNLYSQEDKAEIMEALRPEAMKEGKAPDGTLAQLTNFFLERVKKNLHVVLCLSPIGDQFRTRVRMFPSLVNCCTIDWFNEWPKDALLTLATKFLSDIDLEPKVKNSSIQMIQMFHESTVVSAQLFYQNLRRRYYVTPTSYIEMIKTFKTLLARKRKIISDLIFKYENGYQSIILTEREVTRIREELTKMQPELKRTAEETDIMFKKVEVEKANADVIKSGIEEEEKMVKQAVMEAKDIAADCQRELDEVRPDFEKAQQAIKEITPSQIQTIRSYFRPNAIIKSVLKAIAIIFDPDPKDTIKDEKTLKNVTDWWAASTRVLGDNIIKKISEFNIQGMEERVIKMLGNHLRTDKYLEKKEDIANSSDAANAFYKWAVGVEKLYYSYQIIMPKMARQEQAEKNAREMQAKLDVKQLELKQAVQKVEYLTTNLKETEEKKVKLEVMYKDCECKLERSLKLIDSLGGQKKRWADLAEELKVNYVNLSGDVLVSSGMIAYLGPFTSTYRANIITEWVNECRAREIPASQVFSLKQVLGEPIKIREWNINGLPSDSFSVENAIIIYESRRWPLCIDPQGQANKWIKRSYQSGATKIEVIKLSDSDFIRKIENSIQFGKPVLLQNVGEELDPGLNPILLKQTYGKGTTQYIKLTNEIEWSPQFRLYITTKFRNPVYLPELSTKVTLLNFMITFEGLNDQLLGILVRKERPDLEDQKAALIIDGANNKREIEMIENQILKELSSSGNILDDEKAIDILTKAKIKSNQIKEKQKVAEETEKIIDATRAHYTPVSLESSCLFFAISDLAAIDPMYQYSLTYYIDLFSQAIANSAKSSILQQRLKNLQEYFLKTLFNNISRSLFEKDKLLFSFILAERLLEYRGEVKSELWRFFLTGGISLGEQLPDMPKLSWMTEKTWGQIVRSEQFTGYQGIHTQFYDPDFLKDLQSMIDSPHPEKVKFPDKLNHLSKGFDKLVVIRLIRPDKLVQACTLFVIEQLGNEFVSPPAFDLGKIYPDSNPATPLIFVLSQGSDPFASLNIFGEQQRITITSISLGQGQGRLAEEYIKDGKAKGNWVVLQNCHLAVTWMPALQKIVEQMSSEALHPNYRLWLTSYPSNDFPTSILQAGLKMTNEQPKGLKSNLISSYMTDPISSESFFDSCAKPIIFKNMLFGLCFFHAVIQERRAYGPLGWNIPYEFNESDLRICVRQLKMFLDEAEGDSVPYEALKYLTAECNYGGRVTDDKDRRLINTLLAEYYCPEVHFPGYKFAQNQIYSPPNILDHHKIIEFIRDKYPLIAPPDVFGFHSNANITKDMKEANQLLESLLESAAEEGRKGQGQSMEEVLAGLVKAILGDIKEEYNEQKALAMFPVTYKESMNTVLTQELTRFNKLIAVIRSSLKDISLSIQGLILMSSVLQRAAKSLFDGKVPEMWMEKSYPSLKPLGSYIKDLRERLDFFDNWLANGKPKVFWICGFYFTQSFLTGVLQNYARKHKIPIDEIEFDFEIENGSDPTLIKAHPEDGTFVNGLFIEGAKWSYEENSLAESDPKVLFVNCPIIWLKPTKIKQLRQYNCYRSPVYKTSSRRGVLSTTGHSSNFVMWAKLPSILPEKHWIKRGVALLTQLDY